MDTPGCPPSPVTLDSSHSRLHGAVRAGPGEGAPRAFAAGASRHCGAHARPHVRLPMVEGGSPPRLRARTTTGTPFPRGGTTAAVRGTRRPPRLASRRAATSAGDRMPHAPLAASRQGTRQRSRAACAVALRIARGGIRHIHVPNDGRLTQHARQRPRRLPVKTDHTPPAQRHRRQPSDCVESSASASSPSSVTAETRG